MKHYIFPLLIIALAFSSCGTSSTVNKEPEITDTHKRIAVIPFQSRITMKPAERALFNDLQYKALIIAQAKDVQESIETFLISKSLDVTVMSSNAVNHTLNKNNIDISKIADQSYVRLASLLGVDAIVGGLIETEKPMSMELATGIDIAKDIEKALLGTSFSRGISTSTNKGQCRVSLFDGKTGDRFWSDHDKIELSRGSSSFDVINKLMIKHYYNFPYH